MSSSSSSSSSNKEFQSRRKRDHHLQISGKSTEPSSSIRVTTVSKKRIGLGAMEDDENEQQQRKHIKLSSSLPSSSSSSSSSPTPCESTDDPRTFARSYQLEALEIAIEQNTIAFLETGSGKTLIAIMLLRHYAYLLKKPSQFISVFLVPKVVLVTQQAEAVEMHTDLKVGKYWGEMGVDFWDADTWKKELEKYEVLVMTPQILLDALRHSFFKLEIIKLLIFDECHNARGRSPYTCILTEFYHKESTVLPRIFGMTASPIMSIGPSSNTYAEQILELESLMNSKVYTVSNESVLAEFIPFSTIKLKFYEHLDSQCSLYLSLIDHLKKLKCKHVESFKELPHNNEHAQETASKKVLKLFNTLMYCLTDLGIWLALKAAESLSCTETHSLLWGPETDGIGERVVRSFSQDAFQAFCSHIPSEWHIGRCMNADVEAGLLTAKVNCLVESLMEYRMIKDLRCIIFVERVITAIVLKAMLTELLETRCWNTTYMVGNGSGTQFQTRKIQMSIIDDFRRGVVNIIVATQILEEGLDVQSCNLVLRFDPAATVCSFIQSRGRARMQGSDYLLILRRGDASTLSKVKNHLASGDIMREESLRHASLPCVPFESATYDELFYRVESTGAVVTLSSSIALIYYYCSRLPSDWYFRPTPRFIMETELCTLHLPKSCPIQTITVQGQKDVKRIVCLEACKKLHQIGCLTDNLLPEIVVEEAGAQETGEMPYENEVVNYYPEELVSHKVSSNEWEVYHCYSIVLKQNFDYDVQLRDITLAVNCDRKSDLEDLDFQLHVSRGLIGVNMVYTGTIQLSAEQVLMARRFQVALLRVLRDHNLSELKNSIDGLDQKTHPMVNYLLLPSVHCDQTSSVIDWHCVKSALFPSTVFRSGGHVCGGNQQVCSPEDHLHRIRTKEDEVCRSILVNSLVFTPHNGHLYCITNILDGFNVNSPMKGKSHFTYKEFYKSRHGLNLQYEGESLLRGRQVFKVRNGLQRHSNDNDKEHSNAFVELPPELCVIIMSPLTISTLYSFSLVPSIMHRLESIFLALSLKKMQSDHCAQNVTVPTMKVLEAITTKKCQEDFSLESLETLGDSFLKYAVCQQLFRANKHHHEGLLSVKKSRMVSNNTLCKLGYDCKLQGFIRNECFDPKQWVIPGDTSSCTEMNEISLFTSGKTYIMGTRHMKSKVVADVVEALVGAYLSTCGELAALLFLDWLGMKVVLGCELPCARQIQSERHVNIKHLESLLNYSFREPSLLVEALTHGSYQLAEVPSCYQRLEFLGDSVLDHLITVYMYNKYPRMSPGLITDLRSASVNNDCYARAAVQAGLHQCILHASLKLHKQIEMFVNEFKESSSASTFGWGSGKDLPKVLGDIIESLAGAILVDSGYNKDTVWKCMKPLLEPLVTPDTMKLHPVRELRELCQRKGFEYDPCVSYINGSAAFTVKVKAGGILYCHTCTGANKKTAKKLACQAVLESLKASLPGL